MKGTFVIDCFISSSTNLSHAQYYPSSHCKNKIIVYLGWTVCGCAFFNGDILSVYFGFLFVFFEKDVLLIISLIIQLIDSLLDSINCKISPFLFDCSNNLQKKKKAYPLYLSNFEYYWIILFVLLFVFFFCLINLSRRLIWICDCSGNTAHYHKRFNLITSLITQVLLNNLRGIAFMSIYLLQLLSQT